MKNFNKLTLPILSVGIAISAIAVAMPSASDSNVSYASTDVPAVTPPFLEDFSDGVEALDKMTVIDANADGKMWTVMGMQAKITYNNKLAMDDWMVTRGLNLEAGKAYMFSIDGSNSNGASYVEEFEVKLGTAPTVEAMTMTVLPVSKINSKNNIHFTSVFHVETSGVYYLGVHGCSPKNKRTMYLDNIAVSAPMDGNLPSEVSEAVATPDSEGAYKATISFKAPSLNIIGKELTALSKIEIQREDKTIVKTFSDVKPGDALEYVDEIGTPGNHTWTIIPYSAAGEGLSTAVSTYVGFGKPQPVTNVKVEETDKEGEVKISWTAPEKDLNGLVLTTKALTYKIQDVSGNSPIVLEAEYKDNTYTYKAVNDGEQAFKRYQINAITEGGISSAVITETKAVGAPDKLTYLESFAGSSASHIIERKTVAGSGAWYFCSSAMQEALDGDDGSMIMQAKSLNDAASLTTGKIDLGKAENPIMTFYTLNYAKDGDDINIIKVEAFSPEKSAVLVEKTVKELSTKDNEWNRIEVPLDAFKGKTIQIAITATAKKYVYTSIDALCVLDKVDNNLTLLGMEAPSKIKTGNKFAIDARIRNNGIKKATGFDVDLYRNGNKIKSISGLEIEPEKVDTISFEEILTPLDEENLTYSIKINMATDSYPEDNVSDEMTVVHQLPSLPTPNNFTGIIGSDGKPELSWSAPVTEGVSRDPITDDFESYKSWANSGVGDWTFIDVDKGTIGGSGSNQFPGIDRGSMQSFYVMDSELEGLNASYASHSGVKCLANMFITSGDKTVDDWVISPRLSGDAQKVTFWAKSYQQSNPETFEILYSKTGKEISDFVLLEKKENIGQPWTEFSFDLPTGAVYFAIRCVSVDKYMLMLDDFTYVPEGFANLELKGYNVYRDGVKANDKLITETKYKDVEALSGMHYYRLTAVYEQGESKALKELALGASVINDINVLESNVYGGKGMIVFNSISGNIFVADMSGKVIYNGIVPAEGYIMVASGVYVVVAEDKATKVIVK